MVAPRDSLKDLLHLRHYLSYLHCVEAIQFPLGNLDQPPLITLIHFLACWFKGIRSPKWPELGSLRFQISGMSVVASSRSTPHYETKTYRPTKVQVAGMGRKKFSQWPNRDFSEWNYSLYHPLIPVPMDPGCGKNHAIYWMLIPSIYDLLKNPAPAL